MSTTLKNRIAPSLLSSDFACLASEARRMVSAGADWLHMDVMDGHFVPNITIGPCVVAALRKHTDSFLDCHLMVTRPDLWIDAFADAGANQITFHVEAAADYDGSVAEYAPKGSEGSSIAELSRAIRARGMRCGVALRPKTGASAVRAAVKAGLVDMVLVMTVEPGFGGQRFMDDCMPKVAELRTEFPSLDIQVDGGISASTARVAVKAGANVLVAGSAIFNAPDPDAAVAQLRQCF